MENELWANSMRACVAQDLRRALDAALKRLEVAGKQTYGCDGLNKRIIRIGRATS